MNSFKTFSRFVNNLTLMILLFYNKIYCILWWTLRRVVDGRNGNGQMERSGTKKSGRLNVVTGRSKNVRSTVMSCDALAFAFCLNKMYLVIWISFNGYLCASLNEMRIVFRRHVWTKTKSTFECMHIVYFLGNINIQSDARV